MNHSFRYAVRYRNQASACLAFFIAMASVSPLGALNAPAERRWLAMILFESFWCSWIGLSIWMLLEYSRGRLDLPGDRIRHRGVLSDVDLDAKELTGIHWRTYPAFGRVILRSSAQKVAVGFHNYSAVDRLQIIRCVRRLAPESIQLGWPEFCDRVAVRLVDADPNRELRPGERRVHRNRMDWIFSLAIPILIVASYTAWQTGQLRVLLIVPLAVAFWIFCRFNIPRQGSIIAPERQETGIGKLFLSLAVTSCVFGLMWYAAERFAMHDAFKTICWVAWATVILFFSSRPKGNKQKCWQQNERREFPRPWCAGKRRRLLPTKVRWTSTLTYEN